MFETKRAHFSVVAIEPVVVAVLIFVALQQTCSVQEDSVAAGDNCVNNSAACEIAVLRWAAMEAPEILLKRNSSSLPESIKK